MIRKIQFVKFKDSHVEHWVDISRIISVRKGLSGTSWVQVSEAKEPIHVNETPEQIFERLDFLVCDNWAYEREAYVMSHG